MKIVFFGTGNYALSIIGALKKEFELTIFTTAKEKQDPLIKYCLENKISCLSFSSFLDKDIMNKLRKTKADLAVVVSFRWLLPKEILDLFPKGVLNVHPSLLPRYRGATPGQSAVLNNDKKTGVSIIKLDEKIDHGPILWQKEEEIQANDTAESLYLRLFKLAANSITDVIKRYLKGDLIPIAQDDKKATYVKTLTRKSVYIDPTKPPSPEILNRMIRAYYPWPGVWTRLHLSYGGQAKIVKFLPNKMIQVEGKKPISYKDFENGYPMVYNEFEKIFK
ncbi:MAG: hypothetical protein A2W22_06200 [Candidatus Levybacteria bacterium RBG_16_35_11]|nr:MAG: hypothetical protein A2W22_06200 [Candidatus Levybacteria bacterium RBG_16_35_11]